MSIFSKVSIRSPKYSKFDLSHDRKMSFKMGQLVPMLCQEILPGDRFRVNTELMLRYAPMLAPAMQRMVCKLEYYFIPLRLIWNESEKFLTRGEEGTTVPVWPHVVLDAGEWTGPVETAFTSDGTLPDFLGVPNLVTDSLAGDPLSISVLPFRAYQLVYNEYYRDQNFANTEIEFSRNSGQVTDWTEVERLVTMRNRAYEKDYFTSALPFAQRGPEVLMPVDAEVDYLDQSRIVNSSTDNLVNNNAGMLSTQNAPVVPPGSMSFQGNTAGGSEGIPVRVENIAGVTNTSVTIADFRRASRLQRWMEKMAVAGSRYREQIKAMFDVWAGDARLQRPEFLGGGRVNVMISEILSTFQTADPETALPQGNMAGHGYAAGNQSGFSRVFKEHGFVIGIMTAMPRVGYQNGLSRMWSREDTFDYAWPEFAHIGEQEVLNKEIFAGVDVDPGQNNGLWGYQSRYAEYKYQCSSTHGSFRSSLNYWHLNRIFAALPPLNAAFVTMDPAEQKRIFAVTDETVEDLYCLIYHRIDAVRALPYFGTPSL